MATAAITAHKLTKRYGTAPTLALDDLTLQIPTGEIYGYLGANGAGKSTTLRLLMNFLQPTSGSAEIAGLDSVREAVDVKRHVGYLAGDVALYPKATGRELLDYLAALQGSVDISYRRKLEKRFEADLHKPIETLSKGNRQKLGILQAFMHQPAVLILDEPTSGLDPLMQEVFYETLREYKDRGAAVLMSSHNLAEAQRVCDRIGIIKHGKLIREQSVGEDTELGKTIFRVVLKSGKQAAKLPGLKVLSREGHVLRLQATGSLPAALKTLSTLPLADLTTEQLNLEDEFLEFYGDQA